MKREFLDKLEKLAAALYKSGDSEAHNESWVAKKNFIAGFADAGLTLSLVTSDEVQESIDNAHQAVYGEGRIERQKRQGQMRNEFGEINWDIFEEPAYERSRNRDADAYEGQT